MSCAIWRTGGSRQSIVDSRSKGSHYRRSTIDSQPSTIDHRLRLPHAAQPGPPQVALRRRTRIPFSVRAAALFSSSSASARHAPRGRRLVRSPFPARTRVVGGGTVDRSVGRSDVGRCGGATPCNATKRYRRVVAADRVAVLVGSNAGAVVGRCSPCLPAVAIGPAAGLASAVRAVVRRSGGIVGVGSSCASADGAAIPVRSMECMRAGRRSHRLLARLSNHRFVAFAACG